MQNALEGSSPRSGFYTSAGQRPSVEGLKSTRRRSAQRDVQRPKADRQETDRRKAEQRPAHALDHRRLEKTAMLFSSPPHFGHCSRSMAKTRLSSRAQLRPARDACRQAWPRRNRTRPTALKFMVICGNLRGRARTIQQVRPPCGAPFAHRRLPQACRSIQGMCTIGALPALDRR